MEEAGHGGTRHHHGSGDGSSDDDCHHRLYAGDALHDALAAWCAGADYLSCGRTLHHLRHRGVDADVCRFYRTDDSHHPGLCRRHRLQHPHLFLFPWALAHTRGAKEGHHRNNERDRLVGVLLWLYDAGVLAVVPCHPYPPNALCGCDKFDECTVRTAYLTHYHACIAVVWQRKTSFRGLYGRE